MGSVRYGEVARGWYYVNVNVGVAFEKYRLVFPKDPRDGALVMCGFIQQRGLPLFVIPVWSSNDNWTRWQALANPHA